MEIWKDIKGYEGLYQVSNNGKIKSLKTNKLLKIATNHKGYKITYLYNNSKRKAISIHRLVAINFIPNPDNLPQVNHIDGNKQNNNVNNLEWCTNEYNQKHAQENGLNYTKPIKLIKDKKELVFNSVQSAFRYLNCYANGNYKKVINTDKIFLGYKWFYVENNNKKE